MSLTSGFFNSVNGDRRYDAEQMSSIFEGMITDGVYDSVGDKFAVTPDTGMFINVGTGRAWFNKTWIANDSPISIELTALSPSSLGRNDLIVLKVDHSNAVRNCEFITVVGTPAAIPIDPVIPADDAINGIYHYKFAKIAIPANTTEITQAMITNYIGVTPGVPFVTGIMQVQDLSMIYAQLNAEFMDWWNNVIIPVLDEETATLLANRIYEVNNRVTALSSRNTRIEHISWVGTGTFGHTNPTTLVFSKTPNIILLRISLSDNSNFEIKDNSIYNRQWIIRMPEQNENLIVYGDGGASSDYKMSLNATTTWYGRITINNGTVTFSTTQSNLTDINKAKCQFNTSGVTYHAYGIIIENDLEV